MNFSKIAGVIALALAVTYCSAASVAKNEKKDLLSKRLLTSDISTLITSIPVLGSIIQDPGKFVSGAVATVLSFVSSHDGDIPIPNYGNVKYHINACSISFGKREEEKRWLSSIWDSITDVVDTVVDTVVPGRDCKATVSDPLTGLSSSSTKGSPEDALKAALTNLINDIVKYAQQLQAQQG